MLSRMVLMNIVAFAVFKILLNLVFMQNLLNANNCWHKHNLQNCPMWTHISFWCTFRISYWFCLIFGSLGCRKCCFSHMKWFFLKTRWRNYAETWKGLCGYNSVYNFFVYLLPLKSWVFVVLFLGRRHFQNMVLK